MAERNPAHGLHLAIVQLAGQRGASLRDLLVAGVTVVFESADRLGLTDEQLLELVLEMRNARPAGHGARRGKR